MTIKEFARLCGCNPQTLRYYDRVELLKPVKVDEWSGYRLYDEEQALTFIKIKNLQIAGFTIDEIKGLLDSDNDVIFEAFTRKVKELEARLQKIKEIQQSYQCEMSKMKQMLIDMQKRVSKAMQDYDPTEEFGIDREHYSDIVGNVCHLFEGLITKADSSDFDFTEHPDGDDSEEEMVYLDSLNNPEYEVIYEQHGWSYVKDFFEELPALDESREHALYFEVIEDKVNNTAFANTILGMLIDREPGKKMMLGCNVTFSKDGTNHFWLLRLRD